MSAVNPHSRNPYYRDLYHAQQAMNAGASVAQYLPSLSRGGDVDAFLKYEDGRNRRLAADAAREERRKKLGAHGRARNIFAGELSGSAPTARAVLLGE